MIHVTTSVVLLDIYDAIPMVLLVKRKNEPFKNMWSIPGGFLEEDEELEECAARELREETAVNIPPHILRQTFTIGTKNRDPRGRIITVVYTTLVDSFAYSLCAGDDAIDVGWYHLHTLPDLAADHLEIIGKVRKNIS